jgi:O-antigen ligase
MALSLALNTVALLMTGTRSATLAFLLTLPLMAWTLWRHRSQWYCMQWPQQTRKVSVTVLVVGVLGLGLIPMNSPSGDGSYTSALWRSVARTASVANATEYTQGSFYIRSTMWKATARVLMEHPWTGVGAGAWEVHIPRYQALDTGSETDFYAHNDFLQLLGEYGLVLGGGFCAILLAYGLLAMGRQYASSSFHGAHSIAPSFALVSLMALAVVSMAGFPSRMASTCAMLSVCLAVLAAGDTCSDFRSKFYGSRLVLHPKASFVAAVLCAVALLSAGYFIQRAVRAEYHTVLALKQGKFLQSMTSTEKSAWLDRVDLAVRLNPHNRKLTTMLGDQLAFAGDWKNAARVWESITASRPYVADLWANIAIAHGKTNHSAQALQALEKLKSLQPNTPRTRALEISVWRDLGLHAQAMAQLSTYFDQGVVEPDLVQMAYSLGLQTPSWPLAIRALHLGIQQWPASAADAYFRLGDLYNDPRVGDKAQAVASFQLAMATLAPAERAEAITRVPADLRSQVTFP